MFGGAVHIAVRVNDLTCSGAYIDNMAFFLIFHQGAEQARDVEQSFYIGVYHRVPFLNIPFIYGIQA